MYLKSLPSLTLFSSTSKWCHSPSLMRTCGKLSEVSSCCLSRTSIRTCCSLTWREGWRTLKKKLCFLMVISLQVSHHEVDGGGGSGVDLHEGPSRMPGPEHEADVPGHSYGDVQVAQRHPRLAVEELRRRHHCATRQQTILSFTCKLSK